jgi:hypothetical protein
MSETTSSARCGHAKCWSVQRRQWECIEGCSATAVTEFAALCPTCGGLPTDYHEMTKLRDALKEALDGWMRWLDAAGVITSNRMDIADRIAQMRKEWGL